jgi:hypothetical protein
MDFSEYKFNLNIKACCYYEQLSGKSFFQCNTKEDVLNLVYAILTTSNENLKITFPVFVSMLENKKVSRWVAEQYKKVMAVAQQLQIHKEDQEASEEKEQSGDVMTMMKIASSLIVQHHVDAHYVMYDMALWEIMPFLDMADNVRKQELVDKRFWTFLTISPHIDGKKVKEPEDIVKFDFEKGQKERRQEKFEKDAPAAMAFLLKAAKKKEETTEENGNEQ